MPIVDRFIAVDTLGLEYTIEEHRANLNTSDLGGKSSLHGFPEFRLSTGESVNQLSNDEYEILQLGKKIKRKS